MHGLNARLAIAVVAIAELFGTSLWFSANGVAAALAAEWGIDTAALGHMTSAVQAGFILGTLLLALSGLADRYSPARIFFVASLCGALANLGMTLPGNHLAAAYAWRFLTGLALAGIYPLGMKLVVSWAPQQAGRALGWLVGMLVLGTSLPHLFEAASAYDTWRTTVMLSSALAVLGGCLVLVVGKGPHAVQAPRFSWRVLRAFRHPGFRAAAGGYFGHMWELYALWTVAPLLVRMALPEGGSAAVSAGSFAFIAAGAAGCVLGGLLSDRVGSAQVAFVSLLVSGLLCLLYPLLWKMQLPAIATGILLLVWGAAVVSDSPQFSALIARHAPADAVGSAFAIINGIGFLLTIASISMLTQIWAAFGINALWLLVPGPVLGLILLAPLLRRKYANA